MPVTDADVKKMFREAGVQIHGRIYYEGGLIVKLQG